MDKNKIKSYLSSNFLTEAKETADKPVGLKKTEDIQKANKSINAASLKDVAKDIKANDKALTANKTTNAKEVKKRELDKGEKETHDNVELFQDTMLALDYDSPVDDVFKDRFEKSLAGHPTMGNSSEYANVVQDKVWGGDPNFGQSLVDKTKEMAKVQQNVVGGGNTMLPYGVKNGNYAMNENNNKDKKDKMKRLVFKNPFNGLNNALDLIPESYRVDDKEFEMTDGNESYKVRWEGTLTEGRAIVLMGSDKELVNEDIAKIKHLMGYSSEKTLGNLKGNQRLDENKRFSDIWGKTKSLLTESEDIEESYSEYDDYFSERLQRYYLTRQNFWGQNGRHEPGKLVWGYGGVPASPDFESKEEALEYAIEKGWKESGQISMKQFNDVDNKPKKPTDVDWAKTRDLNESEDIDGQDAPEGEWDEETMKAAEATKHVEGSVAKTKNYPNSPAPKHGQFADVKKKATEATKDVEGSVANEKNYPNTPAVKTGEWDKAVKGQAADAKKHIHMHESYMQEMTQSEFDMLNDKADNSGLSKDEMIENLLDTMKFYNERLINTNNDIVKQMIRTHINDVNALLERLYGEDRGYAKAQGLKEMEQGLNENPEEGQPAQTGVNDVDNLVAKLHQNSTIQNLFKKINTKIEIVQFMRGIFAELLTAVPQLASSVNALIPLLKDTASDIMSQPEANTAVTEENYMEEGTYEEYDRLEEIFSGMDEGMYEGEGESNYDVTDLGRAYEGNTNYMFAIIKPKKEIRIFKNFTSQADAEHYFYDKGLTPAQVNIKNFSFINSGNEIDLNKIPAKYKSFKIA